MDGPSGTGKSTVSKEVARRAGLPHLDTGAFYRVATLAALRAAVDLADGAAVAAAVDRSEIEYEDGRMILNGDDVTEEIRGEAVTSVVSKVAAHAEVRKQFVDEQRRWVETRGGRAVVEGRDIGSVVFPDADIKIYLDARAEVRARRRAAQTGEPAEDVLADIARRDHLDSTRETSPLQVPEGAVVIDTSDMRFEGVVERVLELIEANS